MELHEIYFGLPLKPGVQLDKINPFQDSIVDVYPALVTALPCSIYFYLLGRGYALLTLWYSKVEMENP